MSTNTLLAKDVETQNKEMGWEEQRHGTLFPCRGTKFLESHFSDKPRRGPGVAVVRFL